MPYQGEFELRFGEERRNYESMVGSEGRSIEDGTSTGIVSSAGTPAAETPHIRLKVRGNSTNTPDRGESFDESD